MKKIPIVLSTGLLLAIAGAANAQQDMRIFSGAKLTVAGKMAVFGNVTNDAAEAAGGQLKIQDGASIEMQGSSWQNSNAASNIKSGLQNLGNLTFKAPSASGVNQYLNGGNASFPSIHIASTKPIQLAGNLLVRKQLDFSLDGGYLVMGKHNLTMGPDAAISGFSNHRYIITNGTGLVTKQGLGVQPAFVFPVGNAANDYTPATIEPQNGTANYSVGVQNFSANKIDLNQLQKGANIGRTWIVTSSKPGSTAKLGLVHYEQLGANGYNGLKSTVATYTGNGKWQTNPIKAEANMDGLPNSFWQQASTVSIGTTGTDGIYFTKVSGASKPMREPALLGATIVANPISNLLQVKYDGNEPVTITVSSAEGRRVYTSGKIANGITRINATGWMPGIYQVVLVGSFGQKTNYKVMKM